MALDIPTIDISRGCTHPAVVEQLHAACSEWGFFHVSGHGVEPALRERLFLAMGEFFALSASQKQQLSRSEENFWGYFDKELTKNRPDWKEIYDVDGSLSLARPQNLENGNKAVPWPSQLSGFQHALLAWNEACHSLCVQLLQGISLADGQPQHALQRHFAPGHSSFLRLNHYPVCSSADADGNSGEPPLGISRHSDAGALTALVQDEVPGLQVYRRGVWHSVEPRENCFIINIGDMLQVRSNNRFQAPEHRVLSNNSRERFSAPYFYNPSYESIWEPWVKNPEVALYRPVSWREFRYGRAAGDYADKGEEIQIDHYRINTDASSWI